MKRLTLTLILVLMSFNHATYGDKADGFMSEFVDKFPHLPMKNNGRRGITGRMLLEAKGMQNICLVCECKIIMYTRVNTWYGPSFVRFRKFF